MKTIYIEIDRYGIDLMSVWASADTIKARAKEEILKTSPNLDRFWIAYVSEGCFPPKDTISVCVEYTEKSEQQQTIEQWENLLETKII